MKYKLKLIKVTSIVLVLILFFVTFGYGPMLIYSLNSSESKLDKYVGMKNEIKVLNSKSVVDIPNKIFSDQFLVSLSAESKMQLLNHVHLFTLESMTELDLTNKAHFDSLKRPYEELLLRNQLIEINEVTDVYTGGDGADLRLVGAPLNNTDVWLLVITRSF